MSERAARVVEQALQLTVEERAEVAAEIIASVDGEPDADAEEAWAAEIERRARRAIAGESQGTDWETVRARIEAKLPPWRSGDATVSLGTDGVTLLDDGMPSLFPITLSPSNSF